MGVGETFNLDVLPFGLIETSIDPLLTQYLQFSVSAQNGEGIVFENVTYVKRSYFDRGPQTASIRSNLDNFSADIDTISVNPKGQSELSFNLSSLPQVSDPVEFRIYFYHAPAPGGDWADLVSTASGGTGLEVFGSLSSTTDSPFADIPPLQKFSIQAGTTKVIAGRISTDPTDNVSDPNGGIGEVDTVGNFALAGLPDAIGVYQNTVDSVFNNVACGDQRLTQPGFQLFSDGDWRVDQGRLIGIEPPAETFTVHEASRKATCFAGPNGTDHGLFYRFTTREDHTVYNFKDGKLNALVTIKAAQITPGDWTRLGTLVTNHVIGSSTFVIVPDTTHTSVYHDLGDGVEGATIGETPIGRHVQLLYTVAGQPFDTDKGYTAGPGDLRNAYGVNRQFFRVHDSMRVGVVWQSRDDGMVFATWFGADPTQFETVPLPGIAGSVLAAATSDDMGTLYAVMIQEGDGAPNDTRSGTLLKIAADGAELSRQSLDTSRDGLSIVEFGTLSDSRLIASLHHVEGQLALFMGRFRHRSSDGLNHEAGTAVIYDANTLEQVRPPWEASGHSWDNVMTHTQQGQFLAMDLGDNFPRGIHLHRFDHQRTESRVVYTFKTQHHTAPTHPLYRTCPNGTTYFQHSNDNKTYAELGGVVETAQGIVTIVASERSNLDNCRVDSELNDPRNLALILVRSDFEQATADPDNPSVVTDDLVLSQSDYTVEGEYYNFIGQLKKQRNTGVVWLTDYPTDLSQNASRVKIYPLSNDDILILWELWAPKAYLGTYAMIVRPDGAIVQPQTALSRLLRLNRRDDVFDHNGDIYTVAGDSQSRQIILNIIIGLASR